MTFSQFVNQNVKILGRRLYSPSLKDVAWLEDAQLIILISHTFGWAADKRLDAVRGKKIYRQMNGKLKDWVQPLVGKLSQKPHPIIVYYCAIVIVADYFFYFIHSH